MMIGVLFSVFLTVFPPFPPKAAVLTSKASDVCSATWAAEHRNVPTKTKLAVRKRDGAPSKGGVIDHKLSLQLGGSNDISNLMWQSASKGKAKDRLENSLHAAVCAGGISLPAAQNLIWSWHD